MRRKGAAEARRWRPALERMHSPKLLTVTVASTATAQAGRDKLQTAFRRFCELALGPRGLPGLLASAREFVAQSPDAAQRARFNVELDRFEARIIRKRRKATRPIRMRDLLGSGWRAIEVTYTEAGWHWHIHAALDMAYIPQPFIVAAWLSATRGESQIVDVRAIGKTRDDINEVCKYVSKGWELPDDRARDELRLALYGMQRVKAIGGAVPAEPAHVCPCCERKDCTAHRQSGKLPTLAAFELADGRAARLIDRRGVPTIVVEFKPGFWRVERVPLLDTGAIPQQAIGAVGVGPPGHGPPGG
jgi:hypothetical protein